MKRKSLGIPLSSAKFTAAALFASPLANAALIASDSFLTTATGTDGTYSLAVTDDKIFSQDPTAGNSGFTGAWGNKNSATTSDVRVRNSGLSHPLVPNPATTNDGSAYATNGVSTRTVTRALSTFSRTEPTYYMSSLLRVGLVPTSTNPAMIGLSGPTNQDTSVGDGFQVGIDDGAIKLYYNNTSGSRVIQGTTIYSGLEADITYQFVLRLDLNVNGNNDDRFTVDIYNDTSTVSLAQLSILGSQDPADASFGQLVLAKQDLSAYESGNNTPRFDEFRFGTTLADVSLVPEPGSLGLVALGALGLMVRRKRG